MDGEYLYALGSDGDLVCAKIADGRLYIRDAGALWCCDVKAEK